MKIYVESKGAKNDIRPDHKSLIKESSPNTKLIISIMILFIFLLIALFSGYYIGSRSRCTTKFTAEPKPTATNVLEPTITAYPSSIININENFITPTEPDIYTPPSDFKKTSILNNTLTLCLPPQWESDQWGNIYYNRDASYRPNITYIQELPYTSGSRREAYFQFWESEYPNVRELVLIKDVEIGNNTVLTIYSANPDESKISPDGNLAIVWYANKKLWKAGLSNWSMINKSQNDFLADFYMAISCSF